ncbi:MAG TPA: PAC2 family protein [Acidimicrobiia bacterium]|nr:PAC2 family protein [Acidimicrobiia bacterium]
MAILRFLERGELQDPVLVMCLDGWVNAGSAASLVAGSLGGDLIIAADPDQLFDYRVSRPTLDFVEGAMTRLEWPELGMRRVNTPSRDLLVVSGTEPNWNWQRLGMELAAAAIELGVRQHVSLGAIPWAAPHTRPVQIMSTASDPAHLPPSADLPVGLLRVPAAAVSALEYQIASGGIPTVGFWARVPQYVGIEYPAAAAALIKRLSEYLNLELSTVDLDKAAADQRVQLDAVSSARPEVQAMVEQLEAVVDDAGAVSGEALAAEIERFLRGQAD